MIKKLRRVRKFQLNRNSKNYKELDNLCFLSKNVYNYTLHILKMLWFAENRKDDKPPEYYLDQIDENIRNYVVKTSYQKKNKKTGDIEIHDNYNIVINSSNGHPIHDEKAMFMILGTIMNQRDFRALQTSAARGAVKLAFKSVKSFKKSVFEYFKKKSKYSGMPRFPEYKGDRIKGRNDGRIAFSVDNFKTNKHTGAITINGHCVLDTVYCDESLGTVKQIRVIPKPTMEVYDVEVVYEKEMDIINDNENLMGVDIGVNNLATLTISDKNGNIINSIIIDGKKLKNINHYYNKKIAELNKKYVQYGNTTEKTGKDGLKKINAKSGKKRHVLERKRFNKIDTYMHQASKKIVDIANEYKVGTIFIGHNKNWKQKTNLGKTTAQNFVQIPFNKLIQDIKYKGENHGMIVMEIEESYTSKCSAIDNEEICHHDTYIGKRGGEHNKQFITGTNKLINADVNGCLNILRKGIDTITENKNNIVKINNTIFTPTRYNIGMQETEHAEQNFLDENLGNMSGNNSEMKNFLNLQATVDSHNDEKSPFKK